ncbi:MAG: AraC family transcriptional regulator [Ruminococcus flavefaciens]|nr:AraC family transcriptional regulator [Ruminococcus flavefaciens]
MKINKICLNCTKSRPADIEFNQDFTFFLFRTPVTFRLDGEIITFKESSAVIFSRGRKPDFVAVNKKPVIFDYISFQTSSADRQYMISLNMPINTPVPISDDFVISNTLNSIKSEFSLKGKHHNEFMELSMKLIFISVCETSARKNEPDIPYYSSLKAVRNAIISEPMKAWSVDEICYNMNISRTYFHRLYRQAFGVTCIQDVIQNRIIYACELLKNTDLSVSEISEKCGYENDSYFMRQFRQYKNCTPSEYRKKSKSH